METIEITNFQGRLTRILNGELNSGFAKFTTSFGYDPFSKPMNLTWAEVAGLSTNVEMHPGKYVAYSAWEYGAPALVNPKAVCLITNTQA